MSDGITPKKPGIAPVMDLAFHDTGTCSTVLPRQICRRQSCNLPRKIHAQLEFGWHPHCKIMRRRSLWTAKFAETTMTSPYKSLLVTSLTFLTALNVRFMRWRLNANIADAVSLGMGLNRK